MAGEGQLARNIRAGLKESEMTAVRSTQEVAPQVAEVSPDALGELYFGRPKRIHVQEFACVFGIIFSCIAAFSLYKNGPTYTPAWFMSAAFLLLFMSIKTPRLILPLWSAWMTIAAVLGTCMTFLIVSLVWCLVAVPIGLLLKVIGKKVMDLSYGAAVETYWEERDEKCHDFKLLERQF